MTNGNWHQLMTKLSVEKGVARKEGDSEELAYLVEKYDQIRQHLLESRPYAQTWGTIPLLSGGRKSKKSKKRKSRKSKKRKH
tara:strand:- start:168 stop:413 length:246 start_codon:yes stop_codon:yes gene_type:complete